MSSPDHSTKPEFLAWLSQLGQLIETHASWVVLTEDHAFKFKKPLDLGFLDFTTLEKRERCCQREVELNRRLAPSVYRGVLPLYLGPGGYSMGPASPPPGALLVDWAVSMRRLREQDRADVLLQERRLHGEHTSRLAATLQRFHQSLPSIGSEESARATSDLARNVRENFTELEACKAVPVDAWRGLESAQVMFLDRTRRLLAARAEGGHIKDGHGDLRLEHVYFEGDDVIVVDCIEFNDRFRFADTALDLAFLSMDLRRFGRPDLAEEFLAEVARLSGDHEAFALVGFYESYRATVRGKVAALRAGQLPQGSSAANAEQAEAKARFEQALASLTPAERPRLICVAGLIASGKSTLSGQLARTLHCPVIDSDSLRKRLLGVDPWTSLADAPYAGAYGEEVTVRTYERALALARIVLESGRSLIVDASFTSRSWRGSFAQLARDVGAGSYLIECVASDVVVRERLRCRAQGPSVSDAREELLPALRARRDPIEPGEMDHQLTCDTSSGGEEPTRDALEFLVAH